MDEWLAQIGLKGRALESAVKSCEENFVDDLSVLASLEQDKENFVLAFPQAVIRSAISKALASEEHKGEKAQVPTPMKTEAKQTDKRYFAYLRALHAFALWSTIPGIPSPQRSGPHRSSPKAKGEKIESSL